MNHLIYVSKDYIPNLGPLGPLLHVEKFVVGGWWVVVETHFSVKLETQAEQYFIFPSQIFQKKTIKKFFTNGHFHWGMGNNV